METTYTEPTVASLTEQLEMSRSNLRAIRAQIARDFDSLQQTIHEMDDEDADRYADFLNTHSTIFDEFTVQEEHEITVSVTIRLMARTEDDARREVRDNFDVNCPDTRFASEWDIDWSVDY